MRKRPTVKQVKELQASLKWALQYVAYEIPFNEGYVTTVRRVWETELKKAQELIDE